MEKEITEQNDLMEENFYYDYYDEVTDYEELLRTIYTDNNNEAC